MPETVYTCKTTGLEYVVAFSCYTDEVDFRPIIALDSVDAVFDESGNEVDLDGAGKAWWEQHREAIFAACDEAIEDLYDGEE